MNLRDARVLLVAFACCNSMACSAADDPPAPSSAGAPSDADGGSGGSGGSGGAGSGSGSGGSLSTAGTSAGGASGGAGSPAADAGTPSSADTECVVVQLLDCCPVFMAVTRAELEANSCLVALPFGPVLGTDLRCTSMSCAGIACKVPPPPSRVAVPDGAGGCRFADECATDDDCAIGTAAAGCCGCPQAMPEALLDSNPCALREGELPDRADGCRACTAPVQCAECSPPPAPHCVMGDELRVCE